MSEKNDLVSDYYVLYKENRRLKQTIRSQEATIRQLRETLATLGVDDVVQVEAVSYQKPQRGRPKRIDDTTRERVRSLKAAGMSVREIAKKEGVSIGTVSDIINHEQR